MSDDTGARNEAAPPSTCGTVRFDVYAERQWLPNLIVEASTREGYTYSLYAHLMPFFGHRRLVDIRATTIKQWLTALNAAGLSASNRKNLKMILSAVLTSAVHDELIPSNPCRLVKTDPVPTKPLATISPTQFEQFLAAIPGAMPRILVETAIETGMRWGELTELRPKDFDRPTGVFTVARAVVRLAPDFRSDGNPFQVKDYPKDKEYRLIRVDRAFAEKVGDHIDRHRLAAEDLLFWYQPDNQEPLEDDLEFEPGDRGYTGPNEQGRIYAHGTTTAYTNGKCRCLYCRAAVAAYRRKRRALGKDSPRRRRTIDSDGHIPGRWFADTIIKPALAKAALPLDVKMHRLRHAHASWLLGGGADLMVVKERLGHASIQTTERYLHTLDNADDTALAALDKVRGPRVQPSANACDDAATLAEPTSMQAVMDRMAELQAMLGQMAAGTEPPNPDEHATS
ncbi:tyrosine-type recombinase/integrase [Glycomyces xiaoerkulensis]|uniref:tyrosine-type recombinase/integrase n=1 Tax=Glycomyces xiaoerkulensis TaxID=2038139 RepID=UPI0018E480DC|nr:tyrosine-type recombinase/integrase [Glycomyces xiaoerkulensis]